MENAARGATALTDSDALLAVKEYTKALIAHPTSPDYFVKRSTGFTRLKAPLGPRNDLALKDAEFAVLLGQKRAKREKIQAGQQRRVIALYGLGKYGDAAFLLATMVKWRTSEKKDKMEGDIWKAKIEQKISSIPADDERLKVVAKEYPEIELPGEAEMKDMLKRQLNPDGSFNFDWEDEDTKGESKVAVSDTHTKGLGEGGKHSAEDLTPGDTKTDVSKSAPVPPIRHEWFQNAQAVTVTIYAKGVKKDKAEVDIQEDSVSISFPHPSDPSSSFAFNLDPLFAFIDPAASKSSIMSTKVELTLRKRVSGQKWPALEGTTPLKTAESGQESDSAKAAVLSTLAQPPTTTTTKPDIVPSYPTSSKSGPKNWDKVASDLTAKKKKTKGAKSKAKDEGDGAGSEGEGDDEIDSDYETGDPVDGFFKKLYAGADDDTRRAMMKSFQESNGTALSTNWAEVGKGRVNPVESKSDD